MDHVIDEDTCCVSTPSPTTTFQDIPDACNQDFLAYCWWSPCPLILEGFHIYLTMRKLSQVSRLQLGPLQSLSNLSWLKMMNRIHLHDDGDSGELPNLEYTSE